MKQLQSFSFVVFLLIGLVLLDGCSQLSLYSTDSNSKFLSISIKDLSQNPSTYVGQNISIEGELNQRVGVGYSLRDDEGYYIWVEDNCFENQRIYNYNSEIYHAEGTWLSPENQKWGEYGVQYHYRLTCTRPLS